MFSSERKFFPYGRMLPHERLLPREGVTSRRMFLMRGFLPGDGSSSADSDGDGSSSADSDGHENRPAEAPADSCHW